MLHLDRNHAAALSPHSQSNLILSNSPHSDQHTLLSWSQAANPDRSFYQSPQEQRLAGKPSSSASSNEASATSKDPVPNPSSEPTSTPADSQPQDHPATSPEEVSSPTSSLTPPPDTTSPGFSTIPLPGGESSKLENRKEEGQQNENTPEVDKASRASTPLSELSSAPDLDGSLDNEEKAKGGVLEADTTRNVSESGSTPDAKELISPAKSSSSLAASHSQSSNLGDLTLSASFIADGSSSASNFATSNSPNNRKGRYDRKVVLVLELNALLLKALMEFQAHQLPNSDPRFQQYAARLQTNLAWLAAAADEGQRMVHGTVALPPMQPPPPVEFLSMERIQQIYTELPVVFAKEIMRRQSLAAGGGGSSITTPNGSTKRERSDDVIDISSKRRDTGETKVPTPVSATPSLNRKSSTPQPTPHAASPPRTIHSNGAPNSSPSMPPPATVFVNPSDPQAVAMARERARQAQVRQVQTQQQQQHMRQANRMTPEVAQLSGAPMQSMAGPSTTGQNSPAQTASSSSMAPLTQQYLQILQNPSHPIMQYLLQSIPNFSALPMPQQLQRIHMMQTTLARNQQQQQGSRAPGPQPQISGMVQNQVPGNGMLPGQMGVPNGSPTRISSGQQNNMLGQAGAVEPRVILNGLSPAQQATFATMTPQQRQLFIMQQQQALRSGGSGVPNAAMMNQQMFNAQQRIPQQAAVSSPHVGSPMLGGTMDGNPNFPALRSNAGVPGIARSTRTPSDHAPSPIAPQQVQRHGSQMQDEYRLMMQQSQRGMTPQNVGMPQMGTGGMNPVWSQNQQGSGSLSHIQGGFSMSPTPAGGMAGFVGVPNVSSPIGNQQYGQGMMGGQYPFNAASPTTSIGAADTPGGAISRQTSATPVQSMQQSQMSQHSTPMGDQTSLDFELFNWGQ